MIYNSPTKADDGMRHVKAYTDEKKRCFIQLPGVKVLDIDSRGKIKLSMKAVDSEKKD